MKKVISLVLIFVFILTVAVMPASANILENDGHLYEEKFVSRYLPNEKEPYYAYDELFVHTNEYEEVDWVLVSASKLSGTDFYMKQVIGDWVLVATFTWLPFNFNYAVYDVKSETFVKLNEECLSVYEGLEMVMNLLPEAELIGDTDGDKSLSILDATNIQRAIAQLCEFDSNDDLTLYFDYGGNLNYISDFNRDGERSVLDATAIQMKLAKVEDTTLMVF
ncbi:MAG: hypothetical protein IJE16_07185 [Ruminococcus sp.]|nr:hypothetical protein [Ruminococcus sp.]